MFHILLAFLFVYTSYSEKVFSTECVVEVSATSDVANVVVDSLISDFRYNPENLFMWAFDGVGKQDDKKKESFLIEYKTTNYNPDTGKGEVTFDLIVPGLMKLTDLLVTAQVDDESNEGVTCSSMDANVIRVNKIKNWSRHISINVDYSGHLLKNAYGNLYVVPLTSKSLVLVLDMHVKFGWFFNLFISKKTYSETMEWRVERYLLNLKRAAESM